MNTLRHELSRTTVTGPECIAESRLTGKYEGMFGILRTVKSVTAGFWRVRLQHIGPLVLL
jgi:hypothetical protein